MGHNSVHPGKVLKHVLDQHQVTPEKAAWATKVPVATINAILDEKQEVSAEVALKLAYVFDGKTEDFYGRPRDDALEEAKEKMMGKLGLLRPHFEWRKDMNHAATE